MSRAGRNRRSATGEESLALVDAEAKSEPIPAQEQRRLKARGVVIATGGHLLALSLVFLLDLMGASEIDRSLWRWSVAAMIGVQGLLLVVADRGWDEAMRWDPHFLRLPILASAVLFALYIVVAPESRYLMLMAWFVALLFTAGLEGFWVIVGLGTVMTLLFMGSLWLLVTRGAELSLAFESLRAAVFLAINVYAGFVFERIRRDRDERKELRARLARQAVTDPLTGLPNRRYMEDFLEAEISRIGRYGGRCSLAMIDVDDFKNYNDTLGHLAGDEVLRGLAEVFTDEIRVSDIAARYGGEEFSVIMVNTGRAEAEDAAERLRGKVERHAFPDEDIQPTGDLTVSVGIATYPRDADDYQELVEAADAALYEAKRQGKNRVRAA